ncbi:hypothetical protein BC830DRAFT_376947 [Chytriomyces sp. MP71]|nr:hypothetical protein BC830DRAFT_376947 [Chytriomyces sp. MP71]
MDQLSIYPINESPVKMLVSQSGLLQTLVSLPTQQQSESQRPDASQTEPFLISSQPPHTSHLRTMAQPPPAKSIPNQMNRSTHQQYTPPAQSAVFAAPSPIQTGYYPPTRMHSAPIPLVPLANHNHVPMHHSVVVPLQAPESETTARPILPVPAIASKSMATMTEAQSTREMGTQTDPLPDPVQPPPPTYATQTITLRSNLIASVPKVL